MTEHSDNFSTAVTDFTITKGRSEVMTFSNPLDQIYHAVMIQNPINKYNFEAFTSPLAGLTWLMLLLWIVVTPPILFIASRYTAFNSFVLVFFLLRYNLQNCKHFLLMSLTAGMEVLIEI